MKSVRLSPHVADVRMIITADSLQELFNAALEGMGNLIKHDFCPTKGSETITINLSATDTTSLLIDFLSEVLSETHVNRTIYCSATFTNLTETEVAAQLSGVNVDAFDEDVKAVTYHEADVKQNKDGQYESTIIFDI